MKLQVDSSNITFILLFSKANCEDWTWLFVKSVPNLKRKETEFGPLLKHALVQRNQFAEQI